MHRTTDQSAAGYAPFLLAGSLVLFVLGFWIIRHFAPILGHDQVSYIFEADRFLAGDEIYGPHLAETNPPLIIWFSTVPVILAHHLSLSAVSWFRYIVLFLICCSTAWCARLLRRSGKLAGGVALTLYSLFVIAVELNIGAYDLGQREHLLIILLLPYLLAVATGVVSRLSPVERGALGLVAGCAIWFKPQDVLIVVALELVLALRARTLRRILSIEFIATVLTASALFVLVLVFTPLYVHQVVPLLSNVYWALGTNTTASLLLSSTHYIAAVLAALLGYILLRHKLRDPTTPIVLLACSLAAYIAYAVQHTTWSYHQYPHRALYLLALAYLVLDLLHPSLGGLEKSPLFSGWPAVALSGCVILLICVVALHPKIARYRAKNPASTPLDLFLDQVKPGTTVSALSTSVPALASVYDHGLPWGSRFAHLWMMPAIIQNEMGRTSLSSPYKQLSPQLTSGLAALQRQEVTEDLNYWHPDLVLIPHCTRENPCQGIEGKDLDVLAWFERSPDFTRVWSHYTPQPGIEGYDVYRLAR